ncbi:MAG: hypothetical protein FD181_1932 [Prolixibacteraceae bacterium]|nr:MAG: hypothetical protein FD181_1932 [Prolixibacteraceae bacterium]
MNSVELIKYRFSRATETYDEANEFIAEISSLLN